MCCLVAVNDGKDLGHTVIKQCQSKSFGEINQELQNSVSKFRSGKNDAHNRKSNIAISLPN